MTTIAQITKKLESKKQLLKKLQRKNTGWFREESDLIHDIDLLNSIKGKMEDALEMLNLLKS